MSDLAALARQWASARRLATQAIVEPVLTMVAVEPEPPARDEEPTSEIQQDGIRKMPRPMAFKTWPKGTARLQKMPAEVAERLWAAVNAGDKEAEAAIIRDNEPLVTYRATLASRRDTAKEMTREDLVAHAMIGMLNAVRTFDKTLGFTLATHAQWQIKSTINRAISNEGNVIRVPVHLSKGKKFNARACDDLYAIAAIAARNSLRLDDPLYVDEGDDGSAHDVVASDGPLQDELVGELKRDGLLANLKLLDARTEDMIRRSILDDETLESIGATHNLSRERVRQLRDAGLKKLATFDAIREYGEK